MKKIILATAVVALFMVAPLPTMAQVNVNLGISFGLPAPIYFAGPPEVVVLPDTDNVYVVPGTDVEIFFWNGWWWRPWYGRWYRSRYYDRGWVYYSSVPRFYYDVDPGWRRYYVSRNWRGHPWHYEPIPYPRFQRNWQTWQQNRYWERQRTWGVQGYRPQPVTLRQEMRAQREREYQQRADVQQYRQLVQEQQRHRELRAQQRQQQPRQPQVEQPRRQPRQPQVQQPQRPQLQGRPEGDRGERRR